MLQPVFLFSDFSFDTATGVLTHRKREFRLPEQTARLLQLLLERANGLVSREEIEQSLWPEETYVHHDQGINVAINRLRQILQDNPKNPQYVRTIPKRGYSFQGEVKVARSAPGESSELRLSAEVLPVLPPSIEPLLETLPAPIPQILAPPAHAESPLRFIQVRTFWVAVALVIALATIVIWTRHTRPAQQPILRVGIAPLRSSTEERDAAESFRLELSDAISRMPGVQVPAAAAFASSDAADIPRTARILSLDALLLGSLSKQGDQYDVRFELVRATDATHIGSFEYSGQRKDFPSICDRLQQDVFHLMRLHETVSLQVSKGSTNNPQAYEAYLQGNYSMLERRPESLRRAIDEFTRATMLDQNFAGARAGMAAAYLRLSEYDTDPSNGLLEHSEEEARRALKLDPMLALAHAVLGTAEYKHDRQFVQGEAELREAIRINPNEAAYRNWLSVLLVEEGRFDEAIQQLDLARDQAPFWPSVYAMEGFAGVYARRDAVAIKAARHYVELLPNLPIAHNTLAWVYFDTSHYENAIHEWRQMALLQNDMDRVHLEDRGLNTYRTQGIRSYAKLRLAAIGTRAAGQVNDFNAAEWQACAGNHQQALDQLDRLAKSHDPFLLHIGVDPLFDSFHRDPRFVAILGRDGVVVPPALMNVESGVCQQ